MDLIQACKSNEYGRIFTSYEVLDELLTYVQSKVSKSLSSQLAKYWILEKEGFADFVLMDEEDSIKAAKLFVSQENERRPLSFTDCGIVILCQKTSIDNVATYDQQFANFLNVLPWK